MARSTFPSQNVQNTSVSDHFWKLRCRKSARHCGAKHISKSKCTKHLSVGRLLEVEMSKKCTPLWREVKNIIYIYIYIYYICIYLYILIYIYIYYILYIYIIYILYIIYIYYILNIYCNCIATDSQESTSPNRIASGNSTSGCKPRLHRPNRWPGRCGHHLAPVMAGLSS